MKLDHIAIAAADLHAGTAWVESALGVPLLPGGKHDRYGTHNRLLGLDDGLYLEVIAPDPDNRPVGPRWFGLDSFWGPPRPANWICAVDDIETALQSAPAGAGTARALTRGDLRWQISVPDDGTLPMNGAYPTLLQWASGIRPPGQSLPGSGVTLAGWEVHHPDASDLAQMLPLSDPRITFHSGPARFVARFNTPGGPVTL